MPLKKAGSNWVDGDKFFNQDVELRTLAERAQEGTHTLLTAPRRMGKTSLVRESLRRLAADGDFETIFVDMEDAADPADAISEIAVQSRTANGAWKQIRGRFLEGLKDLGERVDNVTISELRVQLRARISDGNRWRKGDEVFSALAENIRPVLLAIDELPILVNRLLLGSNNRITTDGIQAAAQFLSWLRKNGQAHRGRIVIILSGSVGLEPILQRAGLSAEANIYQPLNLKAWDEDVAVDCLGALAENYNLDLSIEVRRDMCRRLRHHVPHHIQQFFNHLHEYLRRAGRTRASSNDVENVYTTEMLSIRGQVDMEHYEGRLRIVLEAEEYRTALELLTEAAVNDGLLSDTSISQYRQYIETTAYPDDVPVVIEDLLHLLEHDGYLQREDDGYRFLSGFLEDWWLARHGRHFVPIQHRRV